MERKNDNKVLIYGFFLRFAKQNYIPCLKCQKRLHGKISQSNWVISSPISIQLEYTSTSVTTKEVTFNFNFLFVTHSPNVIPNDVRWTPCDNCQKYLINIIRRSELILGNREYTDPPVELWRRWMKKK